MKKLGRLEIFKPDEPIENFDIEKETIAIGRSVGNDLVLDRTGVSRYHVKLEVKDNQSTITDLESVNKTYVDGLPIEANTPRLLRGGEEIQIGDVRLVFHPHTDIAPTIEADTQRISLPTFLLSLEGPHIAIAPAAHAQAFLTIENLHSETQTFHIRVENMPKEWVRVDRTEVDVAPASNVRLGITFKPLRRSTTAPGEYHPLVKVYSEANAKEVIDLKGKVIILPYSGYGMTMGTPLIEGNQAFQLFVHNQGNAPLTLSYRGVCKEKTLVFEFREPQVTLAPGEPRTLTGVVHPASKAIFGQPKEYRYDILAQSSDPSRFLVAVSGKYRIKPMLPAWAFGFSMIGSVIALGLFVLLLVIVFSGGSDSDSSEDNTDTSIQQGIQQTATIPEIQSFVVQETTITLGTPFALSWETMNAEHVSLLVTRQSSTVAQEPKLEANKTAHSLLLQDAGEYQVILGIPQSESAISRQITVKVEPQVIFSVQPTSGQVFLLRHVAQQITLNWDVVWTLNEANVGVTSPQVKLSSNNPQTEYSLEGTFVTAHGSPTVITLPADTFHSADIPLEFTLTVYGPDALEIQRKVSIPVEYPTCPLRRSNDIPVFNNPFMRHRQLITLGTDLINVQLDARDQNGTWLRIILPANAQTSNTNLELGWIERRFIDDTQCNFDLNNLYQTEVAVGSRTPTSPSEISFTSTNGS